MAKKIIWSLQGKVQRKEILQYWLERNKSSVYPKKLDKLLKQAVRLMARHDWPRQITDIPDVYVRLISSYKIYFKEDNHSVYILSIWDTRRDPNQLKKYI